MEFNGIQKLISLVVCIPFLISCDQINSQFGNRYEITKDQSGRTLRLDRRTGEIAVVEGERITTVRDSVQADLEKQTEKSNLAKAKYHPAIGLPQFGLDATIATSWQDENLLYSVSLRPTAKKPIVPLAGEAKIEAGNKDQTNANMSALKVDWTMAQIHTFTLLLLDVPFELARQEMSFNGVVDDSGNRIGMDAKGKIKMSSESYKRIDAWNVLWHRRY